MFKLQLVFTFLIFFSHHQTFGFIYNEHEFIAEASGLFQKISLCRRISLACTFVNFLHCNTDLEIYARDLPLTSETLSLLPAFSSIDVNTSNTENSHYSSKVTCAPELAKTGLGSSAAMTTAVVASILHYLGLVNVPTKACAKNADNMTDADLNLVHAVSQTAHCVAQGKIGSGFDVSAAVYGSQRYVRFSPYILSPAQWMDHHKDDFSHHATVEALLGAQKAMLEVRNLLRQIGEAAGVPIEPESQTHMLDSMMSMEGVLLAGVLGAGGFDAIFAITFGSISRDHVAHDWKTNCVLPLPVIGDPRGFTLEEGDPRERNC